MGLIWTLILRFQLSKHLDFEQYDLKSIKESLLLWCRNRVKHLEFVEIVDFQQSWQNGWAFIALVHSFRPESLNIDGLRRRENRELLAIAFDTAYQQLLIPKILDIDDVINEPDENSILTYVSFFYNLHSRTKNSETNVKRIQYLLTHISDVDNMQDSYINLCRALLEWITSKSALFETDVPVNQAQDAMLEFNNYFFNERCEKLKCRNDCETLYFEIISTQKETGIKTFKPSNGLKVKDLEKSWLNLEVIETKRLSKLKNLINQQRKIRQQTELFDTKSQKFENYIVSKLELLNKIFMIEKPLSLQDLEQHLQQSEAICLDVHDNNMKFDSLISLANELIEQHYGDSQFYSQYLSHIDGKLKRLHELASTNLTTIELTRHLFTDLTCIENILNESHDLYGQINSIGISNESIDSIQKILLNLEKLKYLEIYLIVLEKDYLESQRQFDSIRLDDKYKYCFIIFDIDIYMKKLTDSKSNIVLCRDSIERLKKISEYQIHLNEFITSVECLYQFLNEKHTLTKTDPNDCFNCSTIHFIQRRNNIIKLEIKVMERELYSTCKNGYLLMNSKEHNDTIDELIKAKIEKIKNDFKNFIFTINERTLLIHDCITLYNLIDELRQHEELIKNLNNNFYESILEKIDLYQNDSLYLSEIFDKLGQLSIRMEKYHSDDGQDNCSKFILYLKNYQLDLNNFRPSHIYLIIEINLPDIHLDKFRTIHLNLFELIRDRIDHIKQLISVTRSDFDVRKLKQMLNVKCDDDDKIQNDEITSIQNMPTVAEIDLIFQLFFEQHQHSPVEFEDSLYQRNHFVISDFRNMKVLSTMIKRTMNLLKSARDIVDLCQLNRSIPEEPVFNEMTEIIPIIDNERQMSDEDFSETIKLVTTVDAENVSMMTAEDDEKISIVETETEEQKRMTLIMKKRIFIHKLKNDIVFIHQYFINSNHQCQDLKFKLNFLRKIVGNNVKRIEIYIIEHPDDNSTEIIQTLSNELQKCDQEIDKFQKLSTFKDLLDDFYLNVNNHFDNLKCIQIINYNDLNEKIVRNDMRTIESIEISYIYYKDLFDEFRQDNICHLDGELDKYIVDLTFILEKFGLTIQTTKELLEKRWKYLQEKKKQTRIESFMKRLYKKENKNPNTSLEKISATKVEQSVESIPNEPEYEAYFGNENDFTDSSKLENLIREIEIILFDINCGINMHRYKSEQIHAIYNEAIQLTDDQTLLNKLNFYKKKMDMIIKKRNYRLELEDFQIASEYFLKCCKQDIQTVDEFTQKITRLPINADHKHLINAKMLGLKFNLRHYKSLIVMIQQNHGNSRQPEICSKMVYLNDSFKELESKMNNLNDISNIDEEYNLIQSNVEYITIIIEEYNDIDLETLKELQTKTVETTEQIDCFKNNKLIKENSFEQELNDLNNSINRIAIIIRYKILKHELVKKLKQFENRKSIEDEEFQTFVNEIRSQQEIMDKTLASFDFTLNHGEMFDRIMTNLEVLMKKLDSFSYIIEIDSHRKLLESTDVIIEPKNIRPSSKIIKRIINKKPKKITEIKTFTLQKFEHQSSFDFDSISNEDLINNNYTTPVKYFDDITEHLIKSTTTILNENNESSDEDSTKIYEVYIELENEPVKDEKPKARLHDEIVEVYDEFEEESQDSPNDHLVKLVNDNTETSSIHESEEFMETIVVDESNEELSSMENEQPSAIKKLKTKRTNMNQSAEEILEVFIDSTKSSNEFDSINNGKNELDEKIEHFEKTEMPTETIINGIIDDNVKQDVTIINHENISITKVHIRDEITEQTTSGDKIDEIITDPSTSNLKKMKKFKSNNYNNSNNVLSQAPGINFDVSNETIPIDSIDIDEESNSSTNVLMNPPSIQLNNSANKNDRQKQQQSSKRKKKSKKKSKLRKTIQITSEITDPVLESNHLSAADDKKSQHQGDDKPMEMSESKLISEKNLSRIVENSEQNYYRSEKFNLNVSYDDDWLDYLTPKMKTTSNNVYEISLNRKNNNNDEKLDVNQTKISIDNEKTKLKNQTVQQTPDQNDDENENVTKIEYLPPTQSLSFDIINENNKLFDNNGSLEETDDIVERCNNIEPEIDEALSKDDLKNSEPINFESTKSISINENNVDIPLSNSLRNILHNNNEIVDDIDNSSEILANTFETTKITGKTSKKKSKKKKSKKGSSSSLNRIEKTCENPSAVTLDSIEQKILSVIDEDIGFDNIPMIQSENFKPSSIQHTTTVDSFIDTENISPSIFKLPSSISDDWLDYLHTADGTANVSNYNNEHINEDTVMNTIQAKIITSNLSDVLVNTDKKTLVFVENIINESKSKNSKKSKKNKKRKLNKWMEYQNPETNDDHSSISDLSDKYDKVEKKDSSIVPIDQSVVSSKQSSSKPDRKDIIDKFNVLFSFSNLASIENRPSANYKPKQIFHSDNDDQMIHEKNDQDDERKIFESIIETFDENDPKTDSFENIDSIPILIHSHKNIISNDDLEDEETNKIIVMDESMLITDDYDHSPLSIDSNKSISENQDEDDSALIDLESRIDAITKQIEYIIIQITILLEDSSFNNQQLKIQQFEDLIQSRINQHSSKSTKSTYSKKEDDETRRVKLDLTDEQPKTVKNMNLKYKNQTEQPSVSLNDWIDYLTPATSIPRPTNDFNELINWNEIENVHCDLETNSKTDVHFDSVDQFCISDKHESISKIENKNILMKKAEKNIFKSESNIDQDKSKFETKTNIFSSSDDWMDYLSPQNLKTSEHGLQMSIIYQQETKTNFSYDNNIVQDKVHGDNQNDLKSKEIEMNKFDDNPESIKSTKPFSDDWLDYLTPQVFYVMKSEFQTSILDQQPLESNSGKKFHLPNQQESDKSKMDMKKIEESMLKNSNNSEMLLFSEFNHEYADRAIPNIKITTLPITITESNEKDISDPHSILIKSDYSTGDNREKKAAVDQYETKSSMDRSKFIDSNVSKKVVNKFHIPVSSYDWLDYLSIKDTRTQKSDLKMSIIDLQPLENVDKEKLSNSLDISSTKSIKISNTSSKQFDMTTCKETKSSFESFEQNKRLSQNENQNHLHRMNENNDTNDKISGEKLNSTITTLQHNITQLMLSEIGKKSATEQKNDIVGKCSQIDSDENLKSQLGPIIDDDDDDDKREKFGIQVVKNKNLMTNRNRTLPLPTFSISLSHDNEHSFQTGLKVQKSSDSKEPKTKTKQRRNKTEFFTNDGNNDKELIDKNPVQSSKSSSSSSSSPSTVNNLNFSTMKTWNNIRNSSSSDNDHKTLSATKQAKIRSKKIRKHCDVKSLKVIDMNVLEAKINGNRYEKIESTQKPIRNPKSSLDTIIDNSDNDGSSTPPSTQIKRFKRIFQYSLPFYFFLLLLLLLFLIIPKDENEFNCLLRNDYTMTLKKIYLHGAPPI